MRIVFLMDGETIGVGKHRGGTELDVADDVAGVLIKRGVAAVAEPAELDSGLPEYLNETSTEGEQEDGRE